MAMDEKGLTVKRRGKTETIRAIIVAVGVSERVGPARGVGGAAGGRVCLSGRRRWEMGICSCRHELMGRQLCRFILP